MDQDLIKLLESSGFTEKEAQVYLALLELSQGNVTQISKITGLKRPIIYVILEGLIKRGYASEIPERKINTYQASDPSVILRNLKATTQNFSQMLPIFKTLGSKGKTSPKITYFDTKEGVLSVWGDMSGAEESFFISSYEKIDKHFPGAIEKWMSDYENGLVGGTFRHLLPDNKNEIELTKNFNQNVRILKDLNGMKMDFTIYDNKLAITCLADKPFVVVIESEDIVSSMKPIFEIAWQKGKQIRKDNKSNSLEALK